MDKDQPITKSDLAALLRHISYVFSRESFVINGEPESIDYEQHVRACIGAVSAIADHFDGGKNDS